MIGLDLSFCFENMINADVEKAITENKEQIIEGIKFRGTVSSVRKKLLLYENIVDVHVLHYCRRTCIRYCRRTCITLL